MCTQQACVACAYRLCKHVVHIGGAYSICIDGVHMQTQQALAVASSVQHGKMVCGDCFHFTGAAEGFVISLMVQLVCNYHYSDQVTLHSSG